MRRIELEEYLRGVVPSEMPHAFPPAALEAQAIAARTYAVAEGIDNGTRVLARTVADQVWRGPKSHRASTDAAIEATRGLVLWDGDRVARIRFHADCGGMTAREEDVFSTDEVPHSEAREETFCEDGPRHRYRVKISAARIARAARRLGFRGALRSIAVEETDVSGRAYSLVLSGPSRTVRVRGNAFRLAVGPALLPSTRFSVERAGANFVFEGTGFGHGVGLCQWGARGRAEAGETAEEILSFYYPGAFLGPLP